MIFNNEIINVFIPPWLMILAGLLVSLFITSYAIPVIVRIAKLKNLYDLPNGRTSHDTPVPNLGGVAIFAGVIISSVLFSSLDSSRELKYIIAGMIVLFFIGLKDDFYPLVPLKKFLGQCIATFFVVVPGNIRITNFHDLFGVGEVGYILSILVTFLVILTLINSFNLIDGIDGLASGTGIIASVAFSIMFIITGNYSYAVFSFALAGSLVAFFWYNVFSSRYKIFLGDSGAMITGFIVAVLAVRFNEFSSSLAGELAIRSVPAVTMCVLIVPLFDTLRVVVLRLASRKSPFQADKNHIHHRLLQLGNSHLKVSMIILFINVSFIIMAFLLRGIKNEYLILLALFLSTILSSIPYLIVRKLKFPRSGKLLHQP